MTPGGEKPLRLTWEDLPKGTLIETIKMMAQNAVTLDGQWFRAVEERWSQDLAVQMDEEVWKRQVVVEARRIKRLLGLKGEGPRDVVRAYNFMSGANSMEWDYQEINLERILVYYTHCTIQDSRVRQGIGEFPCKYIWLNIHAAFARAVSPGVKVRCDFAPPDAHPKDAWCRWEFYQDHP
ncbi:MAG: hypothetical protein HY671_10615 [Chloroflexi bacterium]|nr:hypothetical protein [Chloroflexota bacterium]